MSKMVHYYWHYLGDHYGNIGDSDFRDLNTAVSRGFTPVGTPFKDRNRFVQVMYSRSGVLEKDDDR